MGYKLPNVYDPLINRNIRKSKQVIPPIKALTAENFGRYINSNHAN